MAISRRGRKWWVSFSYKGRRFQTATEGRTKREARAELVALKIDFKRGNLVMEQREVWFETLVQRYLEE